MGLDHPLAQAALQEVVDLHAFFETWLCGTVENTHAVFSRLENALGEEFTMVSPSGARLQRPDVIGWLRGAYGTKGKQDPFHIAVVEPELLLLRPPLIILRYIEEQAAGSIVTRRRSTAVFEALAEEGVRWLALHETWISPGS
ncbi:hypothetical protein [Microvirga sp. VF16]|uniref:hypothetical protein n=1 Tax=Microvirga sp. VF16 TaxID=2807101 RepID=UPI00193D991E|nr:hypothetical protein [Microvirga sp. VF16]QRM34220.1 hypothetical protein JO965_33790 [Microvirga sp. VF16]